MPEPPRGVIRDRAMAEQGRDYSGLRFGTITPTDLDGLVDWMNAGWTVIEAKRVGAPFPLGQRICQERHCDDLQRVKPAILLLVEHNTPPHLQIDMARTIVKEYRSRGVWHPGDGRDCRAVIEGWLRWTGLWERLKGRAA